MVDVIPPDRLSENREALFDIRRRNRARGSLETWRDQLRDGPGSDAFRGYLDVALICAFGTLKETPDSFTGTVDPAAVTPLFQYRPRRLRRDVSRATVCGAGLRPGFRGCGLPPRTLCIRGSGEPECRGKPCALRVGRACVSALAGDRDTHWKPLSNLGGLGASTRRVRCGAERGTQSPGGHHRPGDQPLAPRTLRGGDRNREPPHRRRAVAAGRGLLLARLESSAAERTTRWPEPMPTAR